MNKKSPPSLTDIVTLDVRDRLGPLADVITFSCERELGFNAQASMPRNGGGRGRIELGWDLVYGCELLCQAALANSVCFPEVGRPEGETDWYHALSSAPDWTSPGAAFRQILAEIGDISLRPACATRWDFAQRVRTHMIDFVLYHELGHLWHQHREGRTNDHDQAMEMHADSVATILSFMRARDFRDTSPYWRRAWGLGVSLVPYLLGSFSSSGSIASESHPHAAIRLVHARITSVAYPGFDLTHSDWDGFSDDVVQVARHLDIGSAANPFMSDRFPETMAEYTRMLKHFESQDSHGANPPQLFVDLLEASRKIRRGQAGAQQADAAGRPQAAGG